MAPPATKNSGTNRKAQMSVFAGYVLASVGALIGALLLTISLLSPEAFQGLRMMIVDLTSSAGEAGAATRVGSRNVIDAIAGYYEAGSKNTELREEVTLARVKLAEAEALAQENARLKAVLGLARDHDEPVAIGRLIGSTAASTRRLAYLSVGSSDGVEVGMPVTSPKGLVGRVLATGSSSSRILLLTDSESIVPVRRAADDIVAFAEGRSDGSLRIRLINLGVNPLVEGDVFVTSGAGGMFRPGVAVAVITQITPDGGIGRLLSNPAGTDVVLVEPIWVPEVVEAPEVFTDGGDLDGNGETETDEVPVISVDAEQTVRAPTPPEPEVEQTNAAPNVETEESGGQANELAPTSITEPTENPDAATTDGDAG